jgi:hypothetical protein
MTFTMPPLRRSPPPSPSDGERQEYTKRTLFPGDGYDLSMSPTKASPRGSTASPRGPTSPRSPRGSGGGGVSGGGARLATLVFAIFSVVASVSLFATVVTMDIASMRGDNEDVDDYEPQEPSFDSKIARALQNASFGSFGPRGTSRERLRYYDALYYTALQYGSDAESILEVGCASDPYVQHLNWIANRTCVAPYFESYERYAVDGTEMAGNSTTIEKITADFMNYELPRGEKYDLLLCNQVLEHVPKPAVFMKKLISSARTSIISVPYNWPDCGKECEHVSHRITHKKLMGWSAPHVPIYQGIVTENQDSKFGRRIILVFKPVWTNAKKKAKGKSPMDIFKKLAKKVNHPRLGKKGAPKTKKIEEKKH